MLRIKLGLLCDYGFSTFECYRENCANTNFDLFDKNIYLQRNKREIFNINELDLIEIKLIKYIS